MHVKPSATGTPEPAPHRNNAQAEVLPLTHYENFPVASWLCPPRLRPPIAALYHFARTADDIADEGDDSPAQRLATLAAYQAELHATLATGPVAGGRCGSSLACVRKIAWSWPRCLQAFKALSYTEIRLRTLLCSMVTGSVFGEGDGTVPGAVGTTVLQPASSTAARPA